jgi:hypothetical protein
MTNSLNIVFSFFLSLCIYFTFCKYGHSSRTELPKSVDENTNVLNIEDVTEKIEKQISAENSCNHNFQKPLQSYISCSRAQRRVAGIIDGIS